MVYTANFKIKLIDPGKCQTEYFKIIYLSLIYMSIYPLNVKENTTSAQ